MRISQLINELENAKNPHAIVTDMGGRPIYEVRTSLLDDAMPNGKGIYLSTIQQHKKETQFTVNQLLHILKLSLYKNMQVMDASGNRIYAIGYTIGGPKPKEVRIISIADIDIQETLDEYIQVKTEEDFDEYDLFLELGEIGFQLKNFEGTTYYDMAAEYTKTHDWEE